MRKIELKGKQGEEIELTNGANSSLVIKIDGDKIIPDFVDALSYVVRANPHDVMTAAQRTFHHNVGANEFSRSVFAKIRDDLFASIKVEEPETEPAVTIKKKDSKEGKQ